MVKQIRPGSSVVVAVDQKVDENTNRVTTHDEPIYKPHMIVHHYTVAQYPGVARTSTLPPCRTLYRPLREKGFRRRM